MRNEHALTTLGPLSPKADAAAVSQPTQQPYNYDMHAGHIFDRRSTAEEELRVTTITPTPD